MENNYSVATPTRSISNIGSLSVGFLLGIFALFANPAFLRAQTVGGYSFTNTIGSYSEITPDSVVSFVNADDTNWNNILLGFNFRYAGNFFDRICINNNGIVVLGGTSSWGYLAIGGGAGSSGNVFISTPPTGQGNVISAAANDLLGQTGYDVGFTRAGNAGSKVFTVQYRNIRRYGARGIGDQFNFQIRLFETTNVVEIVYGAFTTASTPDVTLTQVGIRSEQDVLTVGGNWASPSRSNATTSTLGLSGTDIPSNGQTFRFAPVPPAPNDLSLINIIAPRPDQTTCLLSNQETVRVVLRNFGTATQTSSPISYRLNGGPVVTRVVTFRGAGLAPGAFDTVAFTGAQGANLSTIGTYRFQAFTQLGTELAPNRVNDTVSNYSINLTGPVTPPTTIFGTLSELTSASPRWNVGQGVLPFGTSSLWETAFPYPSESYAIRFYGREQANRSYKEWLLSPNYTVGTGTFLIFKASITLAAFGSAAGARMGDDSLKVRISTDCGSNWRTIRTFSQADVTAGTLDNVLREFRLPIGTFGTSVRVAFFGTNNNTVADSTYRFHLDDVEFKDVLPNDLGVLSFLSPISGQPGCLLSASENVRVVIRNFGSAPQTQARVKYLVKGQPATLKTQTFNLSPTLPPGGIDTVTFSGANGVNLATAGKYVLVAYTEINGESVLSNKNDTAVNDTVRSSAPFSLPARTVISYITGLNSGWTRGVGPDRPTGTISSWGASNTSFPAPVVNTETVSITASTSTPSQREWYYSPTFQVSPATVLVFKMAVFTAGSMDPSFYAMEDDAMIIRTSTDCGATWQVLRTFTSADLRNGTVANVLREFSLPLSNTTQRMTVGFYFDNNGSLATTGYRIMLDDIVLRDANPNDVGLTLVLTPNALTSQFGCAPTTPVRPVVVVRNYGTAPQNSVTVGYTLNNGVAVRETISLNPPLAATRIDTIQFANGIVFGAASNNTLKFFTALPGDTSYRNDTIRNVKTIFLPDTSLRYANTMDGQGTGRFLPRLWKGRVAQFEDFTLNGGRGSAGTASISARFKNTLPYSWVSAPIFNMPASGNAYMRFDFRIVELGRGTATILTRTDSILVETSTDCGQTFQVLDNINSRNHRSVNNFIPRSYNMTPYLGQKLIVRISGYISRTDVQGCAVDIDNFRMVDSLLTGTKALVAGKSFGVYPNPANDRVTIARNGLATTGKADVELRNAVGQVILTQVITATESTISLSGLPTGVYMIVLKESDGSIARQRFVKE
jgi:hypothetical protein